jgi:cyanophycinase
LLFVFGFIGPAAGAEREKTGALILVGDILSYNQRAVWDRIAERAGGPIADIVVVAAANSRARLYGGYAVRALSRYGSSVELLPIAVSADEFDNDYRQAVRDPDLVQGVQNADAAFFVGGAPQHLSSVLINQDGTATPLATAIEQVYENGGVIVGGILGPGGAHTGLEAASVLEQGSLPERDLFRGLGLIADGWHVDQHFFSPGRFAETLVAMHQLAGDYGIGVGQNTAAVIENDQLEVVGDGGVIIIDLTSATADSGSMGFDLKGVRLSYLDDGDRMDLSTLEIMPHSRKLTEFEIDPEAEGYLGVDEVGTVVADMFVHGRLTELMVTALDGAGKDAVGLTFREGPNKSGNDKGFLFRFYTGDDTFGWLSTLSGSERYTARNVYLDIMPITRRQAENLMR